MYFVKKPFELYLQKFRIIGPVFIQKISAKDKDPEASIQTPLRKNKITRKALETPTSVFVVDITRPNKIENLNKSLHHQDNFLISP